MHFKYSYLLILFILLGCKEPINIDGKQNFYYCAVFEQGGTHMVIRERVPSYEKLLKEKNMLSKNKNAYYYKLKDDENRKILYAYSIRNHKLEKILKTDSKQRLTYIEFPIRDINCTQKYVTSANTMNVTRECSNGDKRVEYYTLDKKLKGYLVRKSIYYKNNRLDKIVMYKNGQVSVYSEDNTLLGTGLDIAKSDLCVPYIEYEIKSEINVYSD